ncbi:hypothetical protein [Alcanivorax quisquiliarum]|uniref:Uncharacterized protein n=1 Tax=Alcanivorax quisquiliarum TaxID=2933565 RepID=A0ABT0E5S4_9GAMM|nr:hypothetical protein [Alcanivorax quisquiliarum]MCK0537137.1 hypothetical protein [Alcanivorax quisquiliarum]
MSHHTDDENEILNELANIIARHADWLDGPTFMRLCEQTARGYFDDLPGMEDFAQALREELGLD